MSLDGQKRGTSENRPRTGYVFHEKYMWHDPGQVSLGYQPCRHWEHAETKRRMHNLVQASGVADYLFRIKPRHATDGELAYFHTPEYIQKVKITSEDGGGEVGDETSIGRGGYEIATLAAGGVIRAVDAVMGGKVQNAYALVRPPGHHATRGAGAGFCVFNNIVVAAEHAFRRWGDTVKRIAIFDFDVHHGNGTQQAFEDDSRVLFISVHQDRCYPQNCGFVTECGSGNGEDFNINVPLPPGSGTGAYAAVLDEVLIPAFEAFKPDLILASCGFDASYMDPLGRMMLGSKDFGSITGVLKLQASRHCDNRLVMVHEGGYSDIYVPFCGVAVLEELTSARFVEDPFLSEQEMMGGHELQQHQRQTIEESMKVVDRLTWRLEDQSESRVPPGPTLTPEGQAPADIPSI